MCIYIYIHVSIYIIIIYIYITFFFSSLSLSAYFEIYIYIYILCLQIRVSKKTLKILNSRNYRLCQQIMSTIQFSGWFRHNNTRSAGGWPVQRSCGGKSKVPLQTLHTLWRSWTWHGGTGKQPRNHPIIPKKQQKIELQLFQFTGVSCGWFSCRTGNFRVRIAHFGSIQIGEHYPAPLHHGLPWPEGLSD